jgi:2'-hydroxyisoflavone reductase
MTITRRDFLAATSLGVAATALAPRAFAGAALRAPESLEILVMGGTGFLGPHLIHAALQRGHKLTMFNRGRTQPRIFVDQYEQVEALQGDRKLADGLAALGSDRRWDAVIDTSAYFPRVVDMSVGLLKDRVKHYTLISTLSVYGERNDINMDESAPVATIEDTSTEEITGASYGPLKALCEQAAEQLMPGRVANIRPGLIVGKGDNTDRYTYWVDRIQRGGRVLAPGTGDDYTQIIDVRDLAEWTVRVAEQNTTGVFNAVTPAAGMTMRAMLEGIHEATGTDAELTWVDEAFLEQHGVQAWQHMTAWVPGRARGYEGFGQTSTKRAQAAGLTTRTPVDTARATLDWWISLPEERRTQLRAGLDAATEAKVLAAWDERDG